MNTKNLTELLNQTNNYSPLDEEQIKAFEQDTRIEHVWSSNAIEGSTLNKYETTSILNNEIIVHSASVKDIYAAVDLNKAYDYMMYLSSRNEPLTQSIIRDLNRLSIAKTHTDWAGVYRVVEAWPNGLENEPYLPPFEIASSMQDLVDWANKERDSLHPVQYAADLHLKFVFIHPFRDGNGRTARLLMNFALTQAGFPVINILPDEESRNKYLDVLAKSQRDKNPKNFEDLIAKYTEETLNQRIKILKLNEHNIKQAKKESNLKKK